MARRRFALERGGAKRLEVRWRWPRRDARVSLDGAPLGPPLDRAAFVRGGTFALPDGAALRVRWAKPAWWSVGLGAELQVERQGVPLPGSDGDPRVVGRRAARLAGGLGTLFLVFGALAAALAGTGGAWLGGLVALEGAILLGLGIAGAFGVRHAILAAAIVLALDAAAQLALVAWTGSYPNPIGLLIRAAVVAELYRGWRRMRPLPPPVEYARVFE